MLFGGRGASGPVSAALAGAPVQDQGRVDRAIPSREPPGLVAVAVPHHGVPSRIAAVRVGGAARVLEVVDAAAPHVGILNPSEVDPDVRVLVAEQRPELDVVLPLEPAPLIAGHPFGPGAGGDGVCGGAEGVDIEVE